MTIKIKFPYSGYSSSPTIFSLPDDQAIAIENMYFDGGAWRTRLGLRQFSNQLESGATPNGLYWWKDANSLTNDVVICAINAKLYRLVYGGDATTAGTMTDCTGTATINANATSKKSFDVLNNILIMAGGEQGQADAVHKLTAYNGNFAALGGSPPAGTCVKVVNNFAFIGGQSGVVSNYSRVNWSNVGDPETWGAANYVDFRFNDGDFVVALGAIGTDLYIFKNRSIGRLSTIPPSSDASVTLGPLITVSTKYGCAGALAIDNMPNGSIVFLGADFHLYIFDGVSFVDASDQSYKNGPNIQSDLSASCWASDSPTVRVNSSRGEIWVIGSLTRASSNKIFCYNYKNNCWSVKTNTNVNVMTSADIGRAGYTAAIGPTVILTGDEDGYVRKEECINTYLQGLYSNTVQQLTAKLEISIFYQLENLSHPRSFVFHTNKPTLSSALTVTAGHDGTYEGSTIFSSTTPKSRQVVPINTLLDRTFVHPSTLQLKLETSSNTQLILSPFFISDEIVQ